jgi:hypothetical protein
LRHHEDVELPALRMTTPIPFSMPQLLTG